MVIEVNERPIDVIGQEGTAWAAHFPFGTEHEVVNDELAAIAKETGKRLFTVWAVEDVILLNLDPGQRLALTAKFIVLTC